MPFAFPNELFVMLLTTAKLKEWSLVNESFNLKKECVIRL